MPVSSALSLKIGTIIDKTLAVVEHSVVPVLLYVAALTVANGAITYFSLNMTRITDVLVFWLAGFAVGVVGAYLLVGAMVRRTGLLARSEGDVFVAYCVLSLLYTLGFVGGLILLVIPGLVVMARWAIAGPALMARGGSATRALSESWERTRGAEWPILVAVFAVMIPLLAVAIACSVLFERTDPVGIVVSQLATTTMGAFLQAMGVAIYGLLESGRSGAAATA